jgi:hypothetical protein
MKVLDLFAGLRGWSQAFKERGHQVFTIDIDEQFDVDLHLDILKLKASDLPWRPDIILASPPCEGFSVMQIGKNWTKEDEPKTDKARHALSLVAKTLHLIEELQPQYYIIENPRAKLRKLITHLERRTVTYCHYGEKRMKPTDLWGNFPPSLKLHEPCNNGDPCHVSAPRGSTTGTQGMERTVSAKIPYDLSLAVCLAAEKDVKRSKGAVK